MSKTKKSIYRAPTKEGWLLAHGFFEVFWKRGRKGFFADLVRINGATFYYCGTRSKLKHGGADDQPKP